VNRGLGKRFTARDGAPPAASAALVGRIDGAPGRYVDRLWQAYLAEGVALLNDGFARAQIEAGAQASGLAVGPLAAAAAIGRETPAPAAARALHGDSVATRLLAAPALEAVRCLEEGLLEDPALADVGSVVALGYPRWTGGVLSWIETLGLPVFVLECDRLALRCGPRFAVPPALRERARTGRKFYAARTA
jgi:3-hydroxyacyl-CoA dehydrogenase/enoyl-CoA hydratase/3-hydroxybutyryl-CoA epimerase